MANVGENLESAESEKFQVEIEEIRNLSSLHCSLDFTKPDAIRNRILLVESRYLYVDDYYLGIWSPVFRSWIFSNDKQREEEIVIPVKRYSHMIEFLECIYPQQKEVSESNLMIVLPLAYEYQVAGLIKRCVQHLKWANTALLNKIKMADRYRLDELLNFALMQVRTPKDIDLQDETYLELSDRTKVKVLETLHAITEYQLKRNTILPDQRNQILNSVSKIQDLPSELMPKFKQKSELFTGTIVGKSGRAFHCSPFYMAAWSGIAHEQVITAGQMDLNCNCSDEELIHVLMAMHPPMLDICDDNVAWVLRGACKLEAVGLIRLCAEHLLFRSSTINMFDKISLIDRCYLYELLQPCLKGLSEVHYLLPLTLHDAYETLSIKAKSAILDRISEVQKQRGLRPHFCEHCQRNVGCSRIHNWVCPLCNRYTGGGDANKNYQASPKI